MTSSLVLPTGVLTLLKYPYPRCVDEPETYDQIRVHAEWGTQFRSPKQGECGPPTFAVSRPSFSVRVVAALLAGGNVNYYMRTLPPQAI